MKSEDEATMDAAALIDEAPEPDYNRLQTLATAYRQSALLFAGIELGVFEQLDGKGRTAEDLAQSLGLERVPAGLLLNGLVSLGVLDREDGCYRVPARFRILVSGEDYFGDQLMLHKSQNESWLQLAAILRGVRIGPSYESQLLVSDRVPSYLDSIEKANRAHADRLLTYLRPLLEGADRILDVGGGHGYHARRIVADTSRATVTILDLERAVDYARQRLADLLPTGRIELVVGDALTHDTTEAFDVVMVNDVLHYFDASQQLEILSRAARAVRCGGTLLVSKFRLSADGTEPMHSSLFSLKMYVNTLRGYLSSDVETAEQFRSLNLDSVQCVPFGADKTVVVGYKRK